MKPLMIKIKHRHMKKINLILILILGMAGYSYSQVAINIDGSNPDSSAMLDVQSDSKGMLIPRVTLTSNTDNTTIENPAIGLLVYNTGNDSIFKIKGFLFWNGSEWRLISNTAADYIPDEADSPEPLEVSTSYIGPYFDQEKEGIRLGDYVFRIYVRPSQEGRYTITDNNITPQIKYVGEKESVILGSIASSEFARAMYSLSGTLAFGLADLRNTNTIKRDIWYGWGEQGMETLLDIEKRQYTFMSMDPNDKYFYFCEFMAVDFTGTNYNATKVFMYIKQITSK